MAENKNIFSIIAIIAIVAIVGIVGILNLSFEGNITGAAVSQKTVPVIITYKEALDSDDIDEIERIGDVEYVYKTIPAMAAKIPETEWDDIEDLPSVLDVQPDMRVHTFLSDSVPQINANQVHAAGVTGSGVKVCIVDTGVDDSHPALNPLTAEYDFVNNDADATDDNGHGTHVAGIVASTDATYKGVAYGSSLMAAKVLDASGSGWTSDVIAGIDWCIANGADVISMSLGGGAYTSTCDTLAIAQSSNNAVDQGVSVLAATGNDGFINAIATPACASKVIAVGAVDKNDARTPYSNEGSELDLVAPGSNIVSARLGGGFTSKTGTSMATPHVAGAAALILQTDQTLTPAQILTTLRNTALDLGSPGFDTIYGYGRVDAFAAYQSLIGPPPPSEQTSTLKVTDGFDQKNEKTLVEDGKLSVVQQIDSDLWETEYPFFTSYQFLSVALPSGATITSVSVEVTHHEEEEFSPSGLQWKLGTGSLSNPTILTSTTSMPLRFEEQDEATDTWDVTSFVATPSALNDLKFVIQNNDNINEKKTLTNKVELKVTYTTSTCVDQDGDGYGTGLNLSECPASTTLADCNDNNAAINPGATELCNGVDDNCNSLIDENITQACGTNVGVCTTGVQTCTNGMFGECAGATLPSPETCDGLDNNCNGAIDDNPTDAGQSCNTGNLGVCAVGTTACVNASLACQQNVQPSTEICDNLDNDCDGVVDSFSQSCYSGPSGTEGVGICQGGTQTCTAGQPGACIGEVNPQVEVCDNTDNNCNGIIDDMGQTTCGIGACQRTVNNCMNGVPQTCPPGTPTTEVCGDGIDNDCDSVIDNGCGTTTRLTVINGYDQKNEETLQEQDETYFLQVSDSDRWEVEYPYYTTFQFSNPSIPAWASITSFKIYVQHYEEKEFIFGNVQWSIGTGWPSSPTIWATRADVQVRPEEENEAVDVWDVTNFVNTPMKVNNIELLIKNNDNINEKKTKINYIYADVTYVT